MFTFLINWIKRQVHLHRMEQKGQIGTRKRKTDNALITAADSSKVLGIFMLVLLWAVSALLLTLPSLRPVKFPLIVNQQAPRTIFADFDFAYEDTPKTTELRKQAAEGEPVYFKMSDKANSLIRQNADNLFSEVTKRIGQLKLQQPYQSDGSAAGNLVAGLNDNTLNALYAMLQDQHLLQLFYEELDSLLGQGIVAPPEQAKYKVGQRVRVIDAQGRDRLPKPIEDLLLPDKAADLLTESVLNNYSPGGDRNLFRQNLLQLSQWIVGTGNLEPDQELTAARRKAASQAIEPVMVGIKQNQPLVIKDQTVTPEILACIKAYEYDYQARLKETNTVQKFFQNTIWGLVLVLFVGLYMYHIHPDVVKSNRKLSLVGIVIILSLFIDYLSMELFFFVSASIGISPGLLIEALPIALPAVLLAVMLGYRVALYVGFYVSSIVALMLGYSFDVALEGMVVCSVSAILVRSATNYRSFFVRTLLAAALSFWLLDFNLLQHIFLQAELLPWAAVLAIYNGVITAVLALVLIFVFELLFNVSTNMSLMVLCDFNHPLLKELQLKAPGTSHHSQNVAMLAEAAAKEVGANPIRARAAALYHDIGKLNKPEYFTENNIQTTNQHVGLHPQMSSMIIRGHVKDGLDLAHRYKLCRLIRDTIEQHHGTDLMQFFYQRALQEQTNDAPVLESQYRYPGPLAHEKEVVIVSLADACEAACRSLEKPTASKIEAMVDEIFRKRIRDGQLNNADITVGDLAKLRESFIRTLTTMYHGRIAYPKGPEKEDEDDLFLAPAKPAAPEPEAVASGNPAGGPAGPAAD